MHTEKGKLSKTLFKRLNTMSGSTYGNGKRKMPSIFRREKSFEMIADRNLRWKILSAYRRVLRSCSSTVEKESLLPFPKETIRGAIWAELLENPCGEYRGDLEVAFVQLESFVPDEEFRVIEEFKRASSIAQELAKTGDLGDLILSARILKNARGDKAVRIQERITEKMRKRQRQIQKIGCSATPQLPMCSYPYPTGV